MIKDSRSILNQARPSVLGYFLIILVVEGCSSVSPSKPTQKPAEAKVVRSYGALIPTPYDRVAVEQSSDKSIAKSAEQQKSAAYKLPAFQNSSSTVQSWSDVGKSTAKEVACWLTFFVCFPVSIVQGFYYAGEEAVQTYKRRNP